MANLSEYPGAAEGDLTGAPVQPKGNVYVPAVHDATPIQPLTLPQGLHSTSTGKAHGSETGVKFPCSFLADPDPTLKNKPRIQVRITLYH